MKNLLSVVGIIISLSAVPANARTRFEPYEARNSGIEGQCGRLDRHCKDGS